MARSGCGLLHAKVPMPIGREGLRPRQAITEQSDSPGVHQLEISFRFRRGKSSRANALEAARLAIGIFVAAAMLFASAALAWTLAKEAGKGVENAAAEASMRPADARDVQVILLPKGGK